MARRPILFVLIASIPWHVEAGGWQYFEKAQRIHPNLDQVRQEATACQCLRIIIETLAATGR